jgi:CheY-like chemotaxis protein
LGTYFAADVLSFRVLPKTPKFRHEVTFSGYYCGSGFLPAGSDACPRLRLDATLPKKTNDSESVCGHFAAVTILYVENHAVFAAQVTQCFLAGHQITRVPSLASARAALAAGHFDLMLCDFDLDDGKGDVLVHECREAGRNLPIIAASSHHVGNTALMKAGASAISSKVDFAGIRRVINEVTWKQMGLPEDERDRNSFLILDAFPVEFRVDAATFNSVATSHGWETTFRCDTLALEGYTVHPRLEVTVVTKLEPQLRTGLRWDRQPAYIEKDGVWDLTSYYEWRPEALEEFTVEILERDPEGMLCWIAGRISQNRQTFPTTQVRVLGVFRHSEDTRRSVA